MLHEKIFMFVSRHTDMNIVNRIVVPFSGLARTVRKMDIKSSSSSQCCKKETELNGIQAIGIPPNKRNAPCLIKSVA